MGKRNKISQPCEAVVWYVLPTIRAALASELSRRGLTQSEISEILGITQSAVSQYLSEKRGSNGYLGKDMSGDLEDLAKDLMKGGRDDLVAKMCEVCRVLRSEGFVCDLEKCGTGEECSACT